MTKLETMGRRKVGAAQLGFEFLQGIHGGPWYSIYEIAPVAGISPARVQQLERAACEKIGQHLLELRREAEAA